MFPISIELFGPLRSLSSQQRIQLNLDLSDPSSVYEISITDLKAALLSFFRESAKPSEGVDWEGLLASSVLANEDRILAKDEKVQKGARLVLLPPVCGG